MDFDKWNTQKIAPYAWLGKNTRSWKFIVGNPFCVSVYTYPLKEITREKIIKMAIKGQKAEKKRFIKLFPDQKWED